MSRSSSPSDLRELVELYLAGRPLTRDSKEIRRILCKQAMPALGDRPLNAISSGDVRSAAQSLSVGEPGQQKFVSALSRVFSFARSKGWIAANPARMVKIHTKPTEQRGLDPSEVGRMLIAIDHIKSWSAADCTLIALSHGISVSELGRLRWEQLDLSNETWRREVRGRSYLLPLSRIAVQVLRKRDKQVSGFVFPGDPPWTPLKDLTRWSRGLRQVTKTSGWALSSIPKTVRREMVRLPLDPTTVEWLLTGRPADFGRPDFARAGLEAWADQLQRWKDAQADFAHQLTGRGAPSADEFAAMLDAIHCEDDVA